MARINSIFDGTKWDSQFFSTADALGEYKPTVYVIDDILPAASFTIFYGPPGSGKTNLVMDACVCAGLQKNFLSGSGFDGFKVAKQNTILWIDVDNGPILLHERFGASLRAHGKNLQQQKNVPLHYASFLDPPFMANDDASVNEMLHRVQKFNADILVFDNLGTISGGSDENSSQMITVCGRLRMIAARTNVAIIAIHHSAKKQESDRQASSRGHGSIDASADNAFKIDADDNALTIQQTKARRHRLPPFGAVFEYEHRPKTRDLYRMEFVGVEPMIPKDYLRAQKLISNLLKTKKEANQSELAELLTENKISQHKARAILATLVKSNILRVKPGQAKNALLYQIGDVSAKISLL